MSRNSVVSFEEKLKSLLKGTEDTFPASTTLFIDGQAYDKDGLAQTLRKFLAPIDAAEKAKALANQAIAAREEAAPQAEAFYAKAAAVLKAFYGKEPAALKTFG